MVSQARRYHEAVSYSRGRLAGGGLDWSDQPLQFKSYQGLPFVELPRQAELPRASLWQAVAGGTDGSPLETDGLSAVLFHAAGLTRSSSHGGVEHLYRACPSAGALYPCEVYLAWPGGGGLAQGLHHYDVSRHGLTLLRTGGVDPARLGLPERSRLPGEALAFVTGIHFRSVWKYRARAYRYLNLDAGHLTEGLALGLGAYRTPYRVELDFADAEVAAWLGVDAARESCLAVVRFAPGHAPQAPAEPGPLPEGVEQFSRCARFDQLPPEFAAVHEAASAVARLDAPLPGARASRIGAGLRWQGLAPSTGVPERVGLFDAVGARRSRRGFVPGAPSAGFVARVLSALCAPLLPPGGHPAEHACLAGLLLGDGAWGRAGLSLLDRDGSKLGLLRDGDMRAAMAKVCLDQLWLRHAAMQVLFFVDFPALDAALGERAIRWAFQAAGRLGQRLYLAAESLGLGACGVGAFYDGEAGELLGLPEGLCLAYVMALGPVRSME